MNNDFPNRLKGIINLRFRGYINQIILKKEAKYFAVSTRSACSNTKPSYVLEAIGLNNEQIRESI